MVKSGFAFHVHHNHLVEWCYDYDGREACIKAAKPAKEQKLRLNLFRLIPKDRLPKALVEAGQAHDEARRAFDEARRAYAEARRASDEAGRAFDEARRAFDEAMRAYAEARQAFDKARRAHAEARQAHDEAGRAYDKARQAFEPELIKLHKELCPDCPWDGETIFSSK